MDTEAKEIDDDKRLMRGGSRIEATVSADDGVLVDKPYNALDAKVSSWRKFMGYVGPGFLVSLAYLDPGNCMLNLSLFIKSIYCSIIHGLINSADAHDNQQWRLICKLDRITDTRYLLSIFMIFFT